MCVFLRSRGSRELIATASGDDCIHVFEKVRKISNQGFICLELKASFHSRQIFL